MTTFRTSFPEQMARVYRAHAAPADLPLEVWAMGARRFGWQTVRRRRLTLRGVKPLGRYPHQFANFSLFGAGAPRTGDGFFQVRTALKATAFQAFLDVLAATRPDTCNLLVLDNARAHQAADLTLPPDVAVRFQPPYAPVLNPCEASGWPSRTGSPGVPSTISPPAKTTSPPSSRASSRPPCSR